MTKTVLALIAAGVLGTGTLLINNQDQENSYQPDTTGFMAQKLNHSRDIVNGLATGDYNAISKAAQALTLISHETDWNVIQSEQYLHASSNFRGSTMRLRNAAHEKNLDGSTLAYIEVTLNCVRCHQYLRDERSKNEK